MATASTAPNAHSSPNTMKATSAKFTHSTPNMAATLTLRFWVKPNTQAHATPNDTAKAVRVDPTICTSVEARTHAHDATLTRSRGLARAFERRARSVCVAADDDGAADSPPSVTTSSRSTSLLLFPAAAAAVASSLAAAAYRSLAVRANRVQSSSKNARTSEAFALEGRRVLNSARSHSSSPLPQSRDAYFHCADGGDEEEEDALSPPLRSLPPLVGG
mmetsp:Transcript_45989/g.90764  ORF Transcript_45989/g.90764 Transcript_45989/m.90764 type:complete len:218 (+) Transcript_45989:126-779(+)